MSVWGAWCIVEPVGFFVHRAKPMLNYLNNDKQIKKVTAYGFGVKHTEARMLRKMEKYEKGVVDER